MKLIYYYYYSSSSLSLPPPPFINIHNQRRNLRKKKKPQHIKTSLFLPLASLLFLLSLTLFLTYMGVLEINVSAAMNAKIIGSGEETIILAHGFGTDQSIWDKIIPSLATHYRVLVFDWNFSGTTTTPTDQDDPSFFDPAVKYSSLDSFVNDLIALMDELKLNSSVFIGHSMSGMIGCLASIKRSDLFKRLILICASPRYLNDEGYEGGFEMPQLDQIFTNIEFNFNIWASHFASLVVDPKDPPSVEKFGKILTNMKPEVALSLAKTIFCGDLRDILEKVHVPCTIIQTNNDIVVPVYVPFYMQKKMVKVKSEVEIIEGVGHFPQLTETKQLLDVLERVLLKCDYKIITY